jgi:hypothetical protein
MRLTDCGRGVSWPIGRCTGVTVPRQLGFLACFAVARPSAVPEPAQRVLTGTADDVQAMT